MVVIQGLPSIDQYKVCGDGMWYSRHQSNCEHIGEKNIFWVLQLYYYAGLPKESWEFSQQAGCGGRNGDQAAFVIICSGWEYAVSQFNISETVAATLSERLQNRRQCYNIAVSLHTVSWLRQMLVRFGGKYSSWKSKQIHALPLLRQLRESSGSQS